FVQADAAMQANMQSIAGTEAQAGGGAAEHRTTDLRAGILQGEVDMAGSGAGDVRQLAFHPQRRHGVVQQLPHQAVERAGGEDFAGVGCAHDASVYSAVSSLAPVQRSSQASTSVHHRRAACGRRMRWFSLGNSTMRAGTPLPVSAPCRLMPWLTGTR